MNKTFSNSTATTGNVFSNTGKKSAQGMRVVRGALCALLTFSLCAATPCFALATTSSTDTNWEEAAQLFVNDKSIQPYSFASSDTSATTDGLRALSFADTSTTLDPADKLDLRERGVVTPVKLQNPWGTCWGFSIIAACETSILSDTNTTYSESKLDLSELQLIGSIYRIGGVPESVDKSQAGEGYQNTSVNPNAGFNAGGFPAYGATMFASGVGPVRESLARYTNKGLAGSAGTYDDTLITCVAKVAHPTGASADRVVLYLTEQEVANIEKEIEQSPDTCEYASIQRYWYTGNFKDDQNKSVYTDWMVDDSLYTSALYNLENGNILPETRVVDKTGAYVSTNLASVKAIQNELQDGRAVSVAFCADTSKPEQTSGQAKYLNQKTWAHYTYDNANPNHAVTIVGYDNSYSKENFGGGDASKQPEADGAWLVKNSWGANTESFPNDGTWGIVDENGINTGYFWLSYYDKSVCLFESFDFDTSKTSDSNEYYIDQYDYLPEVTTVQNMSDKPLYSANIFTASENILINTVSCATYHPNSKVTYQIYLLDNEATTPTDPNHSQLVYTFDETYEYGGYHRTKIDEADCIALRANQRYSIVTLQQCLDDNMYYQGCAVNYNTKPSQDKVFKYEEDTTVATNQKYFDTLYPSCFLEFTGKINPNTGKVYTTEEAEDAATAKVNNILSSSPWIELVQSEVAEAVDVYKNSYFTSVVNKGESWTGSVPTNTNENADQVSIASLSTSNSSENELSFENVKWGDWTTDVQGVIETATQGMFAVDNAPIKTFASLSDWASVEELEALEQAISEAQLLLAKVKISEDGTDVEPSDVWLTQQQYTDLESAVQTAQTFLANAGTNYKTSLKNTTPTSDEVSAARAALTVTAAKGVKEPATPANTSDTADTSATANKTASPQTGDVSAQGVSVLALVSALAGVCAATCVVRRKNHETK